MKLQLNDIINHLLSFNSTDLDIDVKSSELKIKSKYNKDSEDLFILEKIKNTDSWTVSYINDGVVLFTKIKQFQEIEDCLENFKINWINFINNKKEIDSINKGENIKKGLLNFLSNDNLFKDFKDDTWKIEDRNFNAIQLVNEDKSTGFTNVTQIQYKGFVTNIEINYCVPRGDKLNVQTMGYWLFEDELVKYPVLKSFTDKYTFQETEVDLIKENSSNPLLNKLFLLESMQNELAVKSNLIKKQKI